MGRLLRGIGLPEGRTEGKEVRKRVFVFGVTILFTFLISVSKRVSNPSNLLVISRSIRASSREFRISPSKIDLLDAFSFRSIIENISCPDSWPTRNFAKENPPECFPEEVSSFCPCQ